MLADETMAAVQEAAGRCRVALEIAWPIWRETSGIPAPVRGPSEGCCIHSAFVLEATLRERVPEMEWRAVGGHPTDRSPMGGCAAADGEAWQHLWVVGALARLPGEPVVLADVTADQFGGPAVLVERLPNLRYRANSPAAMVAMFRRKEAETVDLLRELVKATGHWPWLSTEAAS